MRPDVLAEHLATTIRGLVGPIALRVASLETTGATVAQLADRVAALETRAPVPGPPGPPGADGKDGRDGLDGKDGAPGLRYCGVYVRGKTYDQGDLVTAGGSAWYCKTLTIASPGASGDWTLMVKAGRDVARSGGRVSA